MLVNFKDNISLDKSILTVGNFDGVHEGHKFIINQMKKISLNENLTSVLITFNPHTRYITDKENDNFKTLTTFQYKIKLLEEFNIDYISIIDFDLEFSRIKYDLFIEKIIKRYNPKAILLGYDSNFGFQGKGNFTSLSKYISNKSYNIKSILGKKLDKEDYIIKSSIIKEHIQNGKINLANKLLGRKFKLFGIIIKGDSIGASIGFPTANLQVLNKQQIIPKVGVYYVNFMVGNNNYKGICNIGYRPTFEINKSISIETHILYKDNINLYNKNVEIEFINFIRYEKKFESKELLVSQIKKDINYVKKIN